MVKTQSLYFTWNWKLERYRDVTPGWMDGQTDRITVANTYYSYAMHCWLWHVKMRVTL